MNISLYSELARKQVVQAREIIKDRGLKADPEGIRSFRHDIFSSRYPELSGLNNLSDMYNMSGCRDLLFHVNEWRFTLEQLKRHLNELGLVFLGFEGIDGAKQDYRKMFPDDPTMTNLDHWNKFEHRYPETFLAMYNMMMQKAL